MSGRIGRARQVNGKIGGLLRAADPPDGLSRDEGGTRFLVIAVGAQPGASVFALGATSRR